MPCSVFLCLQDELGVVLWCLDSWFYSMPEDVFFFLGGGGGNKNDTSNMFQNKTQVKKKKVPHNSN